MTRLRYRNPSLQFNANASRKSSNSVALSSQITQIFNPSTQSTLPNRRQSHKANEVQGVGDREEREEPLEEEEEESRRSEEEDSRSMNPGGVMDCLQPLLQPPGVQTSKHTV